MNEQYEILIMCPRTLDKPDALYGKGYYVCDKHNYISWSVSSSSSSSEEDPCCVGDDDRDNENAYSSKRY